MVIAIISDTHDNIATLNLALQWINKKKIKTIIHCGDLCHPDTLKNLAKNSKADIHFVTGNGDFHMDEIKLIANKYDHISIYTNKGELNINNVNLAFTHFQKQAQKLALTKKYNFVFHGHTHKPWIKKIGSTSILNPGTLAGLYQKATFATLNLKTLKPELHLIEQLNE